MSGPSPPDQALALSRWSLSLRTLSLSKGVERSKGERGINSKALSPYLSVGNYIPLSSPLLTCWRTDSRPALSRHGRPRSSRSRIGSAKVCGPHPRHNAASTISQLLFRNADAKKVRIIVLTIDSFFGRDLSSSQAPRRRKGILHAASPFDFRYTRMLQSCPPPLHN